MLKNFKTNVFITIVGCFLGVTMLSSSMAVPSLTYSPVKLAALRKRKKKRKLRKLGYRRAIKNWFVPANWKGQANLGFVQNTGNTNNTNANGKLNLVYQHDRWSHILDLEAQLNKSDGVRTAEQYYTSLESNYHFGEKAFSYAKASYLRDRFSPYAYTVLVSLGYGANIIKTDTLSLGIQAGPGFRRIEEQGSEHVENHWILYAASNFSWQMTKGSSLTEKLSTEIGRPNDNVTSKTALNTKVIGNLGMQLAFNATYNSYIPPSSSNTVNLDTTTTLSLVYSF